MPTLDPRFEIEGEYGGSDAAVRARAVYAAGFTGKAAILLALNGDSKSAFEKSLANAKVISTLVKMAAPSLADTFEVETSISQAITRAVPLSQVRADLVQMMAEQDEATHTDTSRTVAANKDMHGAGIYAERTAQIDALKGGKRG